MTNVTDFSAGLEQVGWPRRAASFPGADVLRSLSQRAREAARSQRNPQTRNAAK